MRLFAVVFALASFSIALPSVSASQCPNAAQQGAYQPAYPPYQMIPAPNVASGAVIYNPWYPGNVIPFFSTYPFANTPYLPFDRPIPPPIPAPPVRVPPDQSYAIAGYASSNGYAASNAGNACAPQTCQCN